MRTIRDLDLDGKTLLIRVDFNVPQAGDGSVANDRRIRAALPTLRHGLEGGARLVLMTHLGRPKGEPKPELKLDPVAARLEELLGDVSVAKSDQVVGDETSRAVRRLQPGQVLLLENLRFDPGEKTNDDQLAGNLATLGDVYVNDAFAACHRKHASMHAVTRHFPVGSRVAGLLLERELQVLDDALAAPERPVVVLLGGAKVSGKIGAIERLLEKVDHLLVGGAMAYTFLRARGDEVGASRVEEERLELCRTLLERAGGRIVLPEDHVIARRPEPGTEVRVVQGDIPDGWMGLDIGPRTVDRFRAGVGQARTVLWNGPMGMFEDERFASGTEGIARAMAAHDGVTIVGGGESGEAVEDLDLVDDLTHVSTGGGAFVEYLEQGTLPALEVLDR